MEGTGIWSLDGSTYPAKRGDVLYVEPWVFHGLINTGDTGPIVFVVKYYPKGTPLPPAPRGSYGS